MANKRGQRLHPSSPLFDIMSSIRNMAIVGAGAYFASSGSRLDIMFALIFAAGPGWQALEYLLRWYRLDETELVVSEGIIVRKERHVPYSRIQNLDLVRGPLHRLFGVAEVRIQTASGAKPEAVLRVLSTNAIESLRERVGHDGDSPAVEGKEAESPLVALGIGELVRLGLVSNRSMVLIGAAFGLLYQFGDLTDRVRAFLENLVAAFEGTGLGTATLEIIAFLIVLGVVLPGLSVAWAIVRFYGFRLEQRGQQFQITCGLFTEQSASVLRERIQLISVRQSPMHRLFKRVSVRIETAGGSNEGDQLISRKWFVPILPADRAEEIVGEVFPGVSMERVDWRPLAPKATSRMVKKTVISWLLLTVGVSVWLKLWGLVPMLVVLPLLIWRTVRAAKRISYARCGEAILHRSGVFLRTTTITLEDRVQIVTLSQSPFDVRHDHASLSIDTAGAGPAGRTISIDYLEAEQAAMLKRSLVSDVVASG